MDSNFIHCPICGKLCNSDNPPFNTDDDYLCEKCYVLYLDRMGVN